MEKEEYNCYKVTYIDGLHNLRYTDGIPFIYLVDFINFALNLGYKILRIDKESTQIKFIESKDLINFLHENYCNWSE